MSYSVVSTPTLTYGAAFFGGPLKTFEDAGWISHSATAPQIYAGSVGFNGAGTFCVSFSLFAGLSTSPLNSVDVFASCTSPSVTLLGQTATAGSVAGYDHFVFVVQSASASGVIWLPNSSTALNTCFGSNWSSGSYSCVSCSIVQIA